MTLNQIIGSKKDMLTAADVSQVLGSDPNTIRWQAHNEPGKLGFPVIVARSRVKIPRIAFIKFCTSNNGGESPEGYQS